MNERTHKSDKLSFDRTDCMFYRRNFERKFIIVGKSLMKHWSFVKFFKTFAASV